MGMVAARDGTTDLYAANAPDTFWKVLLEPAVSPDEWVDAVRAALPVLPHSSLALSAEHGDVPAMVLGEAIFGPQRWRLSRGKRLYYRVKPMLPRRLALLLRQRYRQEQERQFPLGWPVEDRYVRFQYECLAHVLRARGLHEAQYLSHWPHGHRFALVLTHDVENEDGLRFVEEVANLDERLGFRSSFNFVPERYPIDRGLLASLAQRGFEVGVHGLKHDGKLFSSRRVFEQRAAKINEYLQSWGAVGFRAPYTHRHAEWLQALNVEYDLSFFDTDPHEPMSGGTMSIWPFFLGDFVELPYTLTQDHTLMVILGERSPRLWLEKADYVEAWHGMALVNAHPDYLRQPGNLAIYEQFLVAMNERERCWKALPKDVARWWRERAHFEPRLGDGAWNLEDLPGASVECFAPEVTRLASGSAPSGLVSTSSALRENSLSCQGAISAPSSSSKTQDVGALIVGGDFQGLGIARSLGRRGIPVCIIDDQYCIGRFSRFVSHTEHVADLRDEQKAVKAVLDVGRRLNLQGWVLYPTRDETVAAFSRYRAAITDFFRVPTGEWNTTRWAWDKRNTYRLAEELDIPAPRTWYPRDVRGVEQIEAELPLVIKPAIKEHFIYATKAKAWQANTRAELIERFQQAAALVGPCETMIQEFIPGDGLQQFSYCAFFKEGRAIGTMLARRLRQHPPDFGRASTLVETIDLPILEMYSEKLLRAINYYGLVEVEYKLDPRDGRYKLLDINARTWGYHTLGQQAGVDFPYLLFADQVGEQVVPSRAQAGVKWMRLITDVGTVGKQVLDGRLGWQAYFRSLRDVQVESVFSRDDPLPGLVELAFVPYLYAKRGV